MHDNAHYMSHWLFTTPDEQLAPSPAIDAGEKEGSAKNWNKGNQAIARSQSGLCSLAGLLARKFIIIFSIRDARFA